MRLTKKTDYCLRVLIYLQEAKEKVKIKKIAHDYKISKNHLSVAVNRLSELGYVKTSSGPKGGIELNQSKIGDSVGTVVRKIEKFDIVECFDSTSNTCTLNKKCHLKRMVGAATSAFLAELDQYTIKDLI